MFSTIVADPPWPYEIRGPASSREHRPNSHGAATSSRERYGAMTIDELADMPVRSIAADDANLYLWTTNSFLVEAHYVARAWGFEPKTMVTWVKVKPDGSPSMKTGFYYRGATEHVLFCTGRKNRRLLGDPHPTVFSTPRLPHSVKPEYFYTMVEQQSGGPVLEIFARRLRVGWTSWGNEVGVDAAGIPMTESVPSSMPRRGLTADLFGIKQ